MAFKTIVLWHYFIIRLSKIYHIWNGIESALLQSSENIIVLSSDGIAKVAMLCMLLPLFNREMCISLVVTNLMEILCDVACNSHFHDLSY